MAEVEETLKRIQSHKGVIGTMVVNAEGIPIRTTLDNSTTVQYAGLLHHLTMKAKSTVRDIDPQNDLTFLRIRSKKHEIMVAPVSSPWLHIKSLGGLFKNFSIPATPPQTNEIRISEALGKKHFLKAQQVILMCSQGGKPSGYTRSM
ncbi:dynein light chain roadblock-type 2 isoform X1 [Chlorocebus sabaeus]|uniref:dynein light chain roadblock-type 2 isoform X1 n=1 Tax=Chlorocebus sabaeus TaxID=60711 RepID=UPI0018B0894E|nr:dynein light chain roadblock-type 2 isoform X1 [Chlorocebus sabaeus]